MKSNTELLAIAKAQLGNNGSKYRKYVGVGGSWCDMFVFWLYDANGNGSLTPWKGNQRYYCPASIAWCRKNLAELPPYLAMACDIMYFDWDKNGVPNHIGIVEKRESTAIIHTIEGNTSGGIVDDKKRNTSYDCGIFRPHFVPPKALGKARLDEDGAFEYKSIYMLQVALKMALCDGILGRGTVAELQRRAGLTGKQVDSAWGPTTSRAVQKMIGLTGKDIDGQWGKQSTLALQRWINKECGYTDETVPDQQTYTGAFPDFVAHSGQKINYTAKDLSYAYGTNKAKYTYPKGKAKAAFTTAINKVYPKRSSWSKQCQAGASCDVGAGTVIRYSGIDTKIPRGLDEQIPHLKKSSLWKNTGLTKTSQMKPGDVGIYIGKTKGAHIWIKVDGYTAEASHTNKYFMRLTKSQPTNSNKKTWGIYRATKASVIRTGDRGTEVTKLQNFLNWAGFNCGKADGEFGDNTDKAVKAFQTKVGIEADGEVYTGTLAKMKEYTK